MGSIKIGDITVTAHDDAGNKFISEMMGIHRNYERRRQQFTEFINDKGFSAWHVHDGWVTREGKSGAGILGSQYLEIQFIDEHYGSAWAGYPHSGSKKIVIARDILVDEKFPIYIYKLKKRGRGVWSYKNGLSFLDKRVVEYSKVTRQFEWADL